MTMCKKVTLKQMRSFATILLVCAAYAGTRTDLSAQGSTPSLDSGWVVLSEPRVDLWYHGLAVVGFGETDDSSMYDVEYLERVRATKQELGIYPTPLDERAEKLREEFEKDRAFELFHYVPLYFPRASRERMLQALMAVADQRTRDSTIAGRDTRAGMRLLEAQFRERGQRRWLREFVEFLQEEWDLFYGDFREQTAAGDATYLAVMSRRWDTEVEPAISEFLIEEQLDSGLIYIAPALGLEGRMFEGSSFQRTVHALAVWAPPWNDPRASLFSAVREMCYSAAGTALRSAGEMLSPEMVTRAAVQCGSRLLQNSSPALAAEYRSVFLRAAGVEASGGEVAAAFQEAYQLDPAVLDSVDVRLRIAPGMDTNEPPPLTRWIVESKPQVDLWYHVLAVAAADEPGPLGMYSAEYAQHIREVKQELGIYPTRLDSIATDLRRSIADVSEIPRSILHFLPLYFPRAQPEQMLEALRAIARGRADRGGIGGRDVLGGMVLASQVFIGGRERRVLRDLVDAAEEEWNVFYRGYWGRLAEDLEPRYIAVQSVWDSVFAPRLESYLTRRRLTAGLVVPSPPLGPEGRIVDNDEYVPTDQIVSIQVPLDSDGPNGTVFAFLKELCFLLIDDRELGEYAADPDALEDLRRTAAVRCGGLILQFYAPTLAAPYRRTFLDAVGATEGYTVAAFERVYFLEPEVFDLLREQIRHR